MENTHRESRRRPLVAALLNFGAVGLGQLYNGELKKAAVLYLCSCALLFVFLSCLACKTFIGLLAGIAVALAFQIFVITEAAVRAHKLGSVRLKPFNRWYIYLAVICLSNFVVWPLADEGRKAAGYGCRNYRIPSGAMKPALVPGDHIVVQLGTYEAGDLRFGDVIVFEYPEDPTKDFVKRVIALGGQVIEIRDKTVIIDGKTLNEPYTVFTSSRIIPGDRIPRDNLPPTRIPDGTVFVMGDNRDESHDSRFWGPVPANVIRGKVLYVYWSKDYDRIGKSIGPEP